MRSFLAKYKNHHSATLTLGIPLVLGQLGQIILGIVDGAMIGNYGTSELAAASFAVNVFNMPILFGLGFSYALTPLVGQLFGRREHLEVGQMLRNGIVANLVMGILITALMVVFVLKVRSFGQPEELYPLIIPYSWVILISLIFIMIFNAFKQFADGVNDTKTSMWIMIGGNAFNILGNWLLIYGKWGFPELGLLGAGFATLVSRVLMAAAFAYIFFFTKKYKRYLVGYLRSSYSPTHHKTLNKMGLMVGIQMAMETGIFNISTIMIGWLGSVALAAHHIAITIQTIGFMTYYGIGAATAVRVSNYYGTGDIANAKKAASSGLHIIIAMALAIASGLVLFRHQIASLFNSDVEVIALAGTLLLIGAAYQIADGLQVNYANALRGISRVNAMAIISFICYFMVALPVGYLLGIYLEIGVVGIWLGFPVGLSLAGIFFYIWFNKSINGIRRFKYR